MASLYTIAVCSLISLPIRLRSEQKAYGISLADTFAPNLSLLALSLAIYPKVVWASHKPLVSLRQWYHPSSDISLRFGLKA